MDVEVVRRGSSREYCVAEFGGCDPEEMTCDATI